MIREALRTIRRSGTTEQERDHALAVIEVLGHDPIPELTEAIRRISAPIAKARREYDFARWNRREQNTNEHGAQ